MDGCPQDLNWQLAFLGVLQDNLILSTFLGDAVAGGSVQLALACVNKCTLRSGKMLNHQRSEAWLEEYQQSKEESRLPKEIWE